MKKVFSLIMCIALIGVVVGCGNKSASNSNGGNSTNTSTSADNSGNSGNAKTTLLAKAKKQGYITVGFANENPYAYKTSDGKLKGEAVAVAKEVLDEMGIHKMKGVLTSFKTLIPGLNAKHFDIITAGMWINPTRAKKVLFADPDYRVGEAVGVLNSNSKNIHSYKDIAKTGATVAVMSGAIEVKEMESEGVKSSQIKQFKNQPDVINALTAGRVDCITMTGPSLEAILKSTNNDKVVRVKDFTQIMKNGKEQWGYGGAAFRKENKAFRDAFSAKVDQLKKDGKLLPLIKPFGFVKSNLPGDVTAKQLSTPSS